MANMKCEAHARVFSEHFRMGTERMIKDKETEVGKKREVSMESSKAGTK